jgi:predicted metal-dependent HD superfamily phosphohydrolase
MLADKRRDILFSQWQHTLEPFGVEAIAIQQAFIHLVKAYSSPGRHYHTLKHIHHVLNTIETLQVHTNNLAEVQLAAWFHDVIYDTHAKDNEERSAEFATDLLTSLGIPLSNISNIISLILNTKFHRAAVDDIDSQVLLDADLAILAANPIEFQKYSDHIRQEYAWIPEADYIRGRRKILERFLQRDRIYFTPSMFDIAEQTARHNIKTEIYIMLILLKKT